MRYLLFGSGGILGSGFAEALANQPMLRLRPPWEDPTTACDYIADRVAAVMRSPGPVTVVWAAGVGQVSADPNSMQAERLGLTTLVEELARPGGRAAGSRLIFASSAGAVFAGHGPTRIHDASPTVPISAYGFEKLEQEQRCAALAEVPGWSLLLARYSNVYGLAGGVLRRKGLVDTAVRAVRTSRPMTVYVSPDSRRDYIYSVDAARRSLALAASLPDGCHTRIVATGDTVSVASVIAAVTAVARRRVPATFADRPYSSLQPRTLWFAPAPVPAGSATTPMPVAIHRMLQAPMAGEQ